MSRRDDLEIILQEYSDAKTSESFLKPKLKKLGDQIKTIMADKKLDTFTSNGITATITVTSKESFNDDMAMQIIKKNMSKKEYSKIIKTKEYIDDEALQDAIYNGVISANLLAPCKEVGKPVTTLRIKKEK